MSGSRPVRVFLSSTIFDFRDLRSALRFWLEELGYEVLMSEVSDFERRPDSSTFDACFEAIQYCDFYILLVGERYGSIYRDGISVTNEEFRVAKALADQQRIAMIPFVRKSIWQEAELAAASGGGGAIQAADAQAAEQRARVLAFVQELKATTFTDGRDASSGNLWIYTFDTFAEIVSALRIALRASKDVSAQRLLANLKGEIEANIADVVSKRDGLPFPFYAPLQLPEVRGALQDVGIEAQGAIRRVDAQLARNMGLALLMAAEFNRLNDEALEATIRSGEFLHYDPQSRSFSETEELRVLRRLSEEIGRLRQMAELSAKAPFNEMTDRILAEVHAGAEEIDLLAAYILLNSIILRVCENMARLMASVHRWIVSGVMEAPEIDAVSFESESLRRLQHEAALNEDVVTWLGHAAVVDLLTGARTASGDDADAAASVFPGLGASYLEEVRRFVDNLMDVYIQNGGVAVREQAEGAVVEG